MTTLEFVIDNREQKIIKELEILGIEDFKVEQLELGDIIFREKTIESESEEEHVDTILYIERKTVADLAASIKDGRSAEQKERLKAITDRNRIIYLIEGHLASKNLDDKIEGLPARSIYGNLINTQLKHGIQVYKTQTIVESALYLTRLYQKLKGERDEFFSIKASTDMDYAKTIKKEKKANMTPRVYMHYALSQIPGMSDMKAEPIVDKYQTIEKLIEAFSTCPIENRPTMLQDMRYKNKAGKDTRLGVASKKIYEFLYG